MTAPTRKPRRRRAAERGLVALIAVSAALALAAAATASLTPRTLYQTLLTTKFAPLPDGFYDAKVGVGTIDSRDKKHHAVGDVLVIVDSDNGIDYTIFGSLRDAAARWHEPVHFPSGTTGHVVGKAPGFNVPTEWANGSQTGKNAFGHKVTNGFTSMCALSRVVEVCVVTFSTDNDTSGDVPGAIALLKAGLRHLDIARAKLR